jgi:hypothetical protein
MAASVLPYSIRLAHPSHRPLDRLSPAHQSEPGEGERNARPRPPEDGQARRDTRFHPTGSLLPTRTAITLVGMLRCPVKEDSVRFGPTTPKQPGAATVHELMVTSIQTRIEPRSDFPAASVDPTEARKFIVTCPPTTGPVAVREYYGRRCAAGSAWGSKSNRSDADR